MSVVKVNTYEIGVNNDLTNVVENVDANRLGTDLSHIVWSGSAFVVKTGSIVEANGSLYVVQSDIGLGNSTGFLTFNSATLAFAIVDTSRTGKYDAGKSGYYNSATVRILKWRMTAGGSHGIFNNNIGQNPDPTSNVGLSIGQVNTCIGDDAQAVGARNTSNGVGSMTYGLDNSAQTGGLSFGKSNISGISGVTFGRDNTASNGTGPNVADGIQNNIGGTECSGHGIKNIVSNTPNFKSRGTVYGSENQVYSDNGSAHGRLNTVGQSAPDSAAHGYSNTVNGERGVAFGVQNQSQGEDAVAMGNNCQANDDATVSMGKGCLTAQPNGTTIGRDCLTTSIAGVTLGNQIVNSGARSVAAGRDLSTYSADECVFGNDNIQMRMIRTSSLKGDIYNSLSDLTTTKTQPVFWFTLNDTLNGIIPMPGYIRKFGTTITLHDVDDNAIEQYPQGSLSSSGTTFVVLGSI